MLRNATTRKPGRPRKVETVVLAGGLAGTTRSAKGAGKKETKEPMPKVAMPKGGAKGGAKGGGMKGGKGGRGC